MKLLGARAIFVLAAVLLTSGLGWSAPDPPVWTQQAELLADDGYALGWSAAMDGDTAIVGASSAAYVFVRSGTTWTQQARLTSGLQYDYFGGSVGLSGDTAVIGAFGAAYVFVRSDTTWTEQARLTGSGGAPVGQFNLSVAVSGDTAVIGGDAEAAYVFVRSGTTWTQQAKLTASDGAAGDFFGQSVAVSGGTVLAGAAAHDLHGGAAYVFVRSGTTWTQQAKLTGSSGKYSEFGCSVALSGGTAVIGEDVQSAAYVFEQSGTTWTQQVKLTPSDGAVNDYFGQSVGVSGDTAIVGAPRFEGGTQGQQGTAYAFARSGTSWTQEAEFIGSNGGHHADHFASAVAVSGGAAIVGAYWHQGGKGAAYVFEAPTATNGTGDGGPIVFGGCGCRAAGDAREPPAAVWIVVLGLAFTAMRRRRARRGLISHGRPRKRLCPSTMVRMRIRARSTR